MSYKFRSAGPVDAKKMFTNHNLNPLGLIPALILSFFFALFSGVGSLLGMAAVICAAGALLLLISGPRLLAILILVGAPTVFVFPNRILQSVPVLTTERLFYLGIVGLMMLPLIFKKGARIPIDKAERLSIMFLLVALASYVFAVLRGAFPISLTKDGYFFIQYIMGFSAYMISRRMTWTDSDIARLFDILIFIGILMTGQAVLQFFLGVEIFVPDYMDVPHASEGRVTGTFTNASEYGAVAATILILGLYRFGQTNDSLIRLIRILVLILICIAIALSKTRATWLAALFSLILVAKLDSNVRGLIVCFLCLGLVLVASLLPFLVDFTEFENRFTSVGPIAQRLAAWIAALRMGLQNPILGVGFGPEGFNSALRYYVVDFGGVSSMWASGISVPHNEFLHILSLTGILGILLYGSVIFTIARSLEAQRIDAVDSPGKLRLANYGLVILANWVINGIFVDTGAFWYLTFIVFFILGIVNTDKSRHPISQENQNVQG